MITLGIESTAHTFGVGIIGPKKENNNKNGENDNNNPKISKDQILANVIDAYSSETGGIHPSLAKQHHEKVRYEVIQKALDQAGISEKDIELISFSMGPGLPPCLVVGMNTAKELAAKLKVPLIGVNHCIAHLEIGRHLTKAKNPVLLYVSGANTQIIAYEANKFRIFGETLDQGCGNFIDAFARHTGIGFPGGPKIDALARSAMTRPGGPQFLELPYAVKGMDMSFSGLLTNLKQKYDSKKYTLEDLSYSMQETVFAMLLEVSERALNHCQKDELLLGGGVCCNSRLQEMAQKMCEEGGFKCFIPPRPVLVDNAAMIAWQGLLEHRAGTRMKAENIDIMPNWRTDMVDVRWR